MTRKDLSVDQILYLKNTGEKIFENMKKDGSLDQLGLCPENPLVEVFTFLEFGLQWTCWAMMYKNKVKFELVNTPTETPEQRRKRFTLIKGNKE